MNLKCFHINTAHINEMYYLMNVDDILSSTRFSAMAIDNNGKILCVNDVNNY